MKILLLPGMSKSNKEWADTWAEALSKSGHEVHKIYYDHWEKGGPFDFAAECAKLEKLEGSWKICAVVAKSIGTFLTLYAFHKGILNPPKAVFFGLPARIDGEIDDRGVRIDFKAWSAGYHADTLVIQNEQDPVTSFSEAKNLLVGTPSFTIESTKGDTHAYLPADNLKRALKHLS